MTEGAAGGLFRPWPKTPRWNRTVILTEKIDGTNGGLNILPANDNRVRDDEFLLYRDEEYALYAQSRKRLVRTGADNAGFARWATDNAEALTQTLGVGLHMGEWWGEGVQARGYGIMGKRFSLFNTERYKHLPQNDDDAGKMCASFTLPPVIRDAVQAGLRKVPTVSTYGRPAEFEIDSALSRLEHYGSLAAPGFMRPEGLIVFHTASLHVYKILLENDEGFKGA